MDVFVYRLRNRVSGKAYVGISKNPTLRVRFGHAWEAGKKSPRYGISRAIKKYGVNAFDLAILGCMWSRKAAADEEMRQIAAHDSFGPRGYNMTAGGEDPPRSTPASSAKRVATLSERGYPSPMLGKRHTAESRAKMSVSALGNKNSLGHEIPPDVRAKMSASHTGLLHTEEHRRNLSASLKRQAAKISSASKIWWASLSPEDKAAVVAKRKAAQAAKRRQKPA